MVTATILNSASTPTPHGLLMINSFYVYEHIRPDTGVVFYVGKGCRRRSHVFVCGRNPYYMRVVKKLERLGLSVEVRIVQKDLDEIAALKLERKLILHYGRKDFGEGSLTNITDGGEPLSGWRHSVDFSAKISRLNRLYQADGGYTKGRPFSDEHRAKLREAHARKTPEQKQAWSEQVAKKLRGNTHTLGHKLTDEHKAKISASQKGTPKLSLRGRKHSAETRAKMSAMRKGVPKSPEHRAKLAIHLRANGRSEANRIRLAEQNRRGHSPETIERITIAQRDRRARECALAGVQIDG